MSYYCKINGVKSAINMSKISNFSYKNSSTASAAVYEGTTLDQGNPSQYYSKISNTKKTIYAKPRSSASNSITGVGFAIVYNPSTSMHRFHLGGLIFANNFTGSIHIKILEYSSGGYGTNGSYTTILNKTGDVNANNANWISSDSNCIPLVGGGMSTSGGMSGTRYGITITAKPTSGSDIVLSIPIMYVTDHGTYYKYHFVGPIKSNGTTIISGNLDSGNASVQASGPIDYDVLNLTTKTVDIRGW